MSASIAEVHVVPGVLPLGQPGWYLIGANDRVELGPFASAEAAQAGADFMEEHGWGRHPSPWSVRWSPRGLLLDSRLRDKRRRQGPGAQPAE